MSSNLEAIHAGFVRTVSGLGDGRNQLSHTAAVVIVIYDILVTMDVEIKHFWRKRFTVVQLIYFLNRYYGMAVCMLDAWGAMATPFTDMNCQRWLDFHYFSGLTIVCLVDVILAIRIHALYSQSKKILGLLICLYVIHGASVLAIILEVRFRIKIRGSTVLHYCLMSFEPRWSVILWIPTVLYQLVILALALAKLCSRRGEDNSILMRVFVRDQLVYFLCMAGANGVNIVLWSEPGLLLNQNAATVLALGVPCVLGSRLLINLREVAEHRLAVYDETKQEDLPDLQEMVFLGNTPRTVTDERSDV